MASVSSAAAPPAVTPPRAVHLCQITHLSLLLQVQGERDRRVLAMVNRMNEEGFGSCSSDGEWEAVWPKEISIQDIAGTNREQVCRTLGPRDVLRDLGYRFA